MKKFLKIFTSFIVFVALGVIAYQYCSNLGVHFVLPTLGNLENNITALLPKANPCSAPIPYTLGTFDTKFGISKDYFLSALADAEAVWDKPMGKDFFTYVPDDSSPSALKINLVYDNRQEATSELASQGIVVKDNRASYDSLKIKLATLQAEYNTDKISFNTQADAFNQKQKAYNDEVSYWNAKGGAPKQEYSQIEADRVALQAQSNSLQAAQSKLNSEADEVNALIVSLNRLVSVLNLSVENYNTTIDSSPSESFEEGVYTSDGSSKTINIYEFSNRTKLVRALAHELGHALGLDHVTDPNAIMYKLNNGNNLALTQADITELKTKCGIK